MNVAVSVSNLAEMNFEPPLLALAFVVLSGIVGGELLGRLKLPKVTGWIFTGIALRALELDGLQGDTLARFSPFTDFVLGFIAFTVGATLHLPSLRNAGKRLSLIVISEAIILPAVVVPALMYVGGLDMSVSMILAAIAIAGAPGTTILVVREARARGILSRTLIAAVGLIDMVAVGAFAFSVAMLRTGTDGGLDMALVAVGTEFALAGGIGLATAAVSILLARTVVGPPFVGPMMVAVILGAWGLGQSVGASSILACTFAGIAVSNIRHETARVAEEYLQPFGGVLFAGFYTLAGMRLDFGLVLPMLGLVALYFLARLGAKSLSAYLAMSLAGVPHAVRQYLGLALLPHGGVAVGLIFLVQSDPNLGGMADTVSAVGLAALAINQLLGPSATRFSLGRAGEASKDRPRLLDFLKEQHIVVGLRGRTKEAVIRELADRLYATNPKMPLDKEAYVAQVLEREDEASTCLGKGFMIPHTTIEAGAAVRGVLGLSADGIDLDAYDGRPVHAVVLLATPRTERSRHLEVLAAFATTVTEKVNLREQLYASDTAAHAYNILHAEESEDLNFFLDEAIQEMGEQERNSAKQQRARAERAKADSASKDA